jgi:hypothetical protein
MNEFFAFTTGTGDVIRLPFPADLPLDEREAFMAQAIAAHQTPAPSDEE